MAIRLRSVLGRQVGAAGGELSRLAVGQDHLDGELPFSTFDGGDLELVSIDTEPVDPRQGCAVDDSGVDAQTAVVSAAPGWCLGATRRPRQTGEHQRSGERNRETTTHTVTPKVDETPIVAGVTAVGQWYGCPPFGWTVERFDQGVPGGETVS